MIRTETIIAVKDVAKSSAWYQSLLQCRGRHGGDMFEILADEDGAVLLCLHKWGEHEHPTLQHDDIPVGNGLILFFRVSNLDTIWQNAQKLGAHIEKAPHYNDNSLKNQFTLRDPDSYYIIISE